MKKIIFKDEVVVWQRRKRNRIVHTLQIAIQTNKSLNQYGDTRLTQLHAVSFKQKSDTEIGLAFLPNPEVMRVKLNFIIP